MFMRVAEFVRLSTGSWNDRHLEELLQGFQPEPNLCLHKRRQRFKEEYPLMYAQALKNARKDYHHYLRETLHEDLANGIADGLATLGSDDSQLVDGKAPRLIAVEDQSAAIRLFRE